MATYTRFIALGDSFTEGMQDEKINDQYRGWADRVAEALATQVPGFTYLNLAVRGKLVGQVIDDQIPVVIFLVIDAVFDLLAVFIDLSLGRAVALHIHIQMNLHHFIRRKKSVADAFLQ